MSAQDAMDDRTFAWGYETKLKSFSDEDLQTEMNRRAQERKAVIPVYTVDQCVHRIGTAFQNPIYCDQNENEEHTWYKLCQWCINTGRCKHP